MNKAHAMINWENRPSINTPIAARLLNKLDSAVDVIDDRVVEMDANKATKVEVASLVADVSYNEATGIFTITKKNGSVLTIDTKLEKLAINFKYDATTQQLIITLDDGSKQYIDLSALITQYEFMNTDTVTFVIGSDGKVSAALKQGSVSEEYLEPNYLAKVKVEVAKAQSSADAATLSETNAESSAKAAALSEKNAKASEDTAHTNAESAKAFAEQAESAKNDAESARNMAQTASGEAQNNATASAKSASDAEKSASSALDSKQSAESSKQSALQYATDANTSALKAQGYAIGNTDSAKYYYEQSKAISEGFAGALRPMGTITFAQLPSLASASAGDMYNISDEFVTTNAFKEGAGATQAAGTNVYKTTDGYWDCLAGTPVTGIKGSKETVFRRGNVNLTSADIGAVAEDGDASNTTVAFTDATVRENINTGEKLSVVFGKIKKWFADLKGHAFKDTVNNLTTTATGSALDATQGKTLSDKINNIQTDLALQSTDNLIPYPHKDSTMTSNGITWTDNSDGTITANGTATADSIFLLQNFSVPIGTYTVSGSPNITNCKIQLSGSNDWSMQSIEGSKKTITYSADKAYTYCRCIILKGTTVKDAVFKPQLERGNVAHAYTPYRNNKTAYAICATGRATAAKVAELADFVLTVGTTIAVKFTDTAGTANPTSGNLTLNVNGTGAKAMGYFRSGAKASLIYVHGANFCNNAVHIFTYDGTYWLCMDWNADNNTTYSNMTGATASAAGKAGLVPAPSAGKQGQFLRGDGTWATPVAVQNNLTSTSTTDALSAAQGKVLNNAIVKNANDISTLNSNLSQIGDVIIVPVTDHTLSLGWNSGLDGGSVVIPVGTYLVTTHFRTSTTAQGVLICSSSITERITGGVKTTDYWDMSNTVIAVLGQSTEVKYKFYNTCEDGVKVSVGLELLRIR